MANLQLLMIYQIGMMRYFGVSKMKLHLRDGSKMLPILSHYIMKVERCVFYTKLFNEMHIKISKSVISQQQEEKTNLACFLFTSFAQHKSVKQTINLPRTACNMDDVNAFEADDQSLSLNL